MRGFRLSCFFSAGALERESGAAAAAIFECGGSMVGAGDDSDKQPSRKRRAAPSWSDLPPDVLRLISYSLTNIWDHIRFRSTCTSWRCAADRAPHIPSLLLPYDPATTARSFLDPSDRTVHTIHLPESRRKWLYGTPYGWLVMLGKQEMHDGWLFTVSLINPITKAQILLPPLPRNITRLPELRNDHLATTHCSKRTKPILTASPDPKVLLALLVFSELAICRLGVGGTWTVVKLGTPSAPCRVMLDLAYFDEAFYAVDDSKGITVVSTKSLKRRYSAPPKYSRPICRFTTLYLVESCGDLLLLEINKRGYEPIVEVSKLGRGSSSWKLNWVRVTESLGGRALFASNSQSSISQPSTEFMRCWGPDVVCFTDVSCKDDDRYGTVNVINVCIKDIVAGSAFPCLPYHWQHRWRALTPRGQNLTGLAWLLPSLQQIDNNGSLWLTMNQVPNTAIEDNRTRGEKDLTQGGSEWPNLPSDVLVFISQKLTSTWDYVRFRGVCSSWRSAASPGYRLPPQIPSLLLPYEIATTTRSFFDPSDSQVHTIDIPEARGKWLYGTPYGWLVMLGEEEKEDGWVFSVTLLNPITRAEILLPPMPQEITRLPEQRIGESTNNYSSKPLLTGNPASAQGYPEALVGLLIFSKLTFCRPGLGEAWTVVDLGIPSAPRRVMVEFTYFDGAFYVVDISKGVTVVSTNPPKRKYSAPPSTRPIPHYHTLHLAELSGDLLLLEIHKIRDGTLIEVEKLDRSTKKLKWVRAKESMGGCALFVSHNHSSISLCPSNLPANGQGFICFASDESKYASRFGDADVATVSMSVIDSGVSIVREPYWQGSRRVPAHGYNFVGLTWIIPSLC